MASLDPPVPVSASHKLGVVSVLFSTPLVPGAVDHGNWTGRLQNQTWDSPLAAATVPNKVLIDINIIGAEIGPDVVSYSPPPFDVLSHPGLVPAAAFADYPIT